MDDARENANTGASAHHGVPPRAGRESQLLIVSDQYVAPLLVETNRTLMLSLFLMPRLFQITIDPLVDRSSSVFSLSPALLPLMKVVMR